MLGDIMYALSDVVDSTTILKSVVDECPDFVRK